MLFYRYDGAEWMEHINPDGSLLYIESYVSSTVREKQALAVKNSREKKSQATEKSVASSSSNLVKLKKESEFYKLFLWILF